MHESSAAEPDGVVVEAVLAGQKERFALLVRRYQGPLLRVAQSRLGRREWAEDAVQETFLCAYKWLAGYDSRYSFRTWLWTILLNQCRRQGKRRARRPRVLAWSHQPVGERGELSSLSSAPCREPGPAAQVMAIERSRQVEALLASLPVAQADALRLRFYGGLQFDEIAAAMGCSMSGAKNRVRCGLLKIGHLLVSGETP